jgi:glycosyltransferase involved in cell wall biosynthesis
MMAMNGVKAAIVPLGVDLAKFNRDIPPMELGNDKFKFLSVGIPHARKGFDLLLRAFADEFKPDEPVALVIKTDKIAKPNYWEVDICKEIAKVQEKPTAQIILISGECANLAPIYMACDVYVSPTRAEGFGLTILEAMACGLPCVVSNFGGHIDFCENILVTSAISFAPPNCQYHTFQKDSKIAEPHVPAIMKVMRQCFEARVGKENFNVSSWTWDAAARKLLDIIGVPDEDKDFKAWIDDENSQS